MPERSYAFQPELSMPESRSAAEQIGRLSQQVETLAKDVEGMEIKLDRLVAAFAAADSLVTLVKWAAALVGGAVVVYAAARQWFSGIR